MNHTIEFLGKPQRHDFVYSEKIQIETAFDTQIDTLRACGVPKDLVDQFLPYRNIAVQKALKIEEPYGEIPLLLVIPRQLLPLATQMSLVRIGNHHGVSRLIDNACRDLIENPTDTPYILYDICSGWEMRGGWSQSILAEFERCERYGFIAEQGIALCAHFETHKKHHVTCIATEYLGDLAVIGSMPLPPDAHTPVDRNKIPILARTNRNKQSIAFGVPSCAGLIPCRIH